jgi:hypothetical protein
VFEHSWFKSSWLNDVVGADKSLYRGDLDAWFYTDVISGGIGYSGSSSGGIKPVLVTEIAPSIKIMEQGLRDFKLFSAEYGVTEERADGFAASTLDFGNDHKLPDWVRGIVTVRDISTSVPVYKDVPNDTQGVVVIGGHKRGSLPYYKSYTDLKSAALRVTSFEWVKVDNVRHDKYNIYPLRKKVRPDLELRPGITYNMVNLTDDFSMVFSNWTPSNYENFPRSWVIDYVRGNLKPRLSPRAGWGMDIVGHVGSQLLNAAVIMFLSTHRPSLSKWDTLLDNVNRAVPYYLSLLKVRVVE